MKRLLLIAMLLMTSGPGLGQAEPESEPPVVFSVPNDETLPVDELSLLLDPLTEEDLSEEVLTWRGMLQTKLRTIAEAQIAMKYMNRDIEVVDKISTGLAGFLADKQALKDFQATAATDTSKSTAEKLRGMEQSFLETRFGLRDLVVEALSREAKVFEAHNLSAVVAAAFVSLESRGEAGSYTEFATVETGLANLNDRLDEANVEFDPDDQELMDLMTAEITEVLRKKQGVANLLVAYMEALMKDRSELVKRLEVVITEWGKKGASPEDIASIRMFVDAVTGFKMTVADPTTQLSMAKVWVKSEAGGIKVAKDLGKFVGTMVLFGLLAMLTGFITSKSIHRSRNVSRLMQDFIIRSVRRVIMLAGFMVGLSLAGVDIGPILGVVGAAGFILAFALQSTLGNFASGIMIMVYKPFDVGDAIDAAGIQGVVKTMNLTSTIMNTFDNKLVIIPNNSIWGGVITNITGSQTRRVDLIFRVGYGDDTERAMEIMNEVLAAEERVLAEPAPMVKIHELGEFTVNFICRPWVNTTDYWDVRWDLIRQIRERFTAAGFAAPIDQSVLFNRPPSK